MILIRALHLGIDDDKWELEAESAIDRGLDKDQHEIMRGLLKTLVIM